MLNTREIYLTTFSERKLKNIGKQYGIEIEDIISYIIESATEEEIKKIVDKYNN